VASYNSETRHKRSKRDKQYAHAAKKQVKQASVEAKNSNKSKRRMGKECLPGHQNLQYSPVLIHEQELKKEKKITQAHPYIKRGQQSQERLKAKSQKNKSNQKILQSLLLHPFPRSKPKVTSNQTIKQSKDTPHKDNTPPAVSRTSKRIKGKNNNNRKKKASAISN
jgi:hypothetical protein